MTTTLDPLLTKKEASRELRLSVRTLENFMRARRLAYVKLGRCVRIQRSELERLKQTFTIEAVS